MPLSNLPVVLRALGLSAGIAVLVAGCNKAEENKAEAPAPASEQAADVDAIATVNGDPITEEDITLASSDLDPQFARLPELQRRAATLSALIEIKLLAQQARKQGMDETEAYKRRMKFLADRSLHSALVRAEITDSVSDEDVRARYDKEIGEAGAQEELKIRHILVKTEDEAKEIISQLDGGADFAKLAEEKSTGPSGKSGGDLGFVAKGATVPEFEKAAFALEDGTYTKEPVKTSFGWHVILVEERREKAPPTFESLQEQVRSLLLREKYFGMVEKLRKDAAVDVKDAELKDALGQLEGQQQE